MLDLLGELVDKSLVTPPGSQAGQARYRMLETIRQYAHDRPLALVGLGQATPDQIKEWGNPELALVYLVILLALALLGGGRFSLDAGLCRKRR